MNDAHIGLQFDQIDALSDAARELYNAIFDYCTYAADPQYQQIHRFRKRIAALPLRDRDALIAYFNAEPAIQDHNMQVPAWQYYADPY